jgi:hypothetical protein
MEMESLEELTLRGNRDDFFTKHSMKDSKFKLKALAIEDFRYMDISEQARINFGMFVLQSAETLKSFNFNVWFSEDINLSLNKLPALEHLNIDAFLINRSLLQEISKLKLEPNGTIKSLKCRSIVRLPKETKFLACLTNLEILTAIYIRKEYFEWIARNMPTLKELRIRIHQPFEKEAAEAIKTFYKELKKNSNSSINRNIEIVIMNALC